MKTARILSSDDLALKLANSAGINRWKVYLEEWLESYTSRWRADEALWKEREAQLRALVGELRQQSRQDLETILAKLGKGFFATHTYVTKRLAEELKESDQEDHKPCANPDCTHYRCEHGPSRCGNFGCKCGQFEEARKP